MCFIRYKLKTGKLCRRFTPLPYPTNVSSPSLWHRLVPRFLNTVGTKQFFRIFSPWVNWLAMTSVANELFGDLINNQDPADDISTLLAELRQQSDARSFFLPTQFVQ